MFISIAYCPTKSRKRCCTHPQAVYFRNFCFFNQPYSADYFKVSYYDKLSPEIDHRDVYKNISEIESYVSGKIKDEKLLDDINTYNLIIEPIKHFLNINDQIKPEKQLSMISQYVKLKIQEKKHNEKLEKVKDAILKVTGEKRG
jgi:hypothetical protein